MDILIIAHFVTEFVKDGTSRFVYIAENLSEGHEVELVTSRFDHTGKRQRTVIDCDLKTKITLLEEPSYPRNVCLQRFFSHAQFGKQVKKYLESRKKPDVIYCAIPSLDCAFYAAKYARENNVKFVIDVQDLWPEAFKMIFNVPVVSDLIFAPMKRRANYIYACADTVVSVSETYCGMVKAVNKKNAEAVAVYLGTKIDNFDKYAAENQVIREGDKFVIGYCGTLGHSYDIKCVLDAMIALRQKGYGSVSFWVMGDGPLKTDFEKYAAEHDLDVVFYGRVPYEKMCGLLSACDVCVNPITGTSVASIINKHGDYAAAGIPVINTQSSAEYQKLIGDYQCGINCAPSSAREVADAIAYFIDNPREISRMGKQSRKLAEDKFDRAASYNKIFNLFG